MIKKLILLLIAAVAPLHLDAKALPTNFVQKITLTLNVVGPGSSTATHDTVSNAVVTAATAIKALGQATSNSFSAKAQFLEMASVYWYTNPVISMKAGKPVTNNYVYGYATTPRFVIQDGAKTIDVTAFVTLGTVNTDTIASSTHHLQGSFTDYTAYKQFRLRTISISQTPISFSAQGFVTTPTLVLTLAPNITFFAFDDNWTAVTGIGSVGGNPAIFQGTISATFLKLE